jgi:hypothetical protein
MDLYRKHNMVNSPSFLFNRKLVDESKVLGAPFMAAGDKIPEKDTIHGFDSEDSFVDWLQSAGFKDAYDELRKRNVEMEKARFASDLSQLKHEQESLINDLMRSSGSPSSNTPALYEHIDFRGRFLRLYENVPYPKLSLFGFSDIVSSVIASGICVLYEHDWFKGRNFAVIGRANSLFDFNDRTSSTSADVPIEG